MKTVLKWLGIAATALVCVLMLGAALIYRSSNRHANRRYANVGSSWLAIPHDPATIARGEHLSTAIAKCVECHGDNLGGTMFIDDPALGRIPAPNLTRGRGGLGSLYTDEELARVIQHGVKRDGRAAIIMPAESFVYLTDDDLAAVIAYLRSVPPVDSTWPAPRLGTLGRILIGTGVMPAYPAEHIDHERRDVGPPVEPDTTPEYGRYLALVGGCPVCHNPAMSGGKNAAGDPASPPAANLTRGGSGALPESLFVRALREGKQMGSDMTLDNRFMPWRNTGHMTDPEIHAVWLYFQSLPPKETGQR